MEQWLLLNRIYVCGYGFAVNKAEQLPVPVLSDMTASPVSFLYHTEPGAKLALYLLICHFFIKLGLNHKKLDSFIK